MIISKNLLLWRLTLIHFTHVLHWLTHTDAGLAFRILAGCAIFAGLVAVDLRKHGRSALLIDLSERCSVTMLHA